MSAASHVALLVATARGRRVLAAARDALPQARFTVVSFREEEGEPPFFDDIRGDAEAMGARFEEARFVGRPAHAAMWDDAPDVLIACSWRYLVPSAVYTKARLGAFVMHDSLLPQYRGFAPTVWAMANGASETGATLLRMADGVDEGDIIAQAAVPIGPSETIAEVMPRVTDAYCNIVREWLPQLAAGRVPAMTQDHAGATYTCKRTDRDNQLHWERGTRALHDLIRAVTAPYAGAWTTLNGERLTLWRAAEVMAPRHWVGRVPGRVVEIRQDGGVVVLTGDGELLVHEVQRAGHPRQPAAQVLTSLGHTLT